MNNMIWTFEWNHISRNIPTFYYKCNRRSTDDLSIGAYLYVNHFCKVLLLLQNIGHEFGPGLFGPCGKTVVG